MSRPPIWAWTDGEHTALCEVEDEETAGSWQARCSVATDVVSRRLPETAQREADRKLTWEANCALCH